MANEMAGVCAVCGRAGRMNSCTICGALVCEMHFDPMSGMCLNCRRGRRMGRL